MTSKPESSGVPPTAQPLEITAIYRAHAQQVTRWAGRLGGPTVEVDDIVQEVFLVAHRQLANFRGESTVSTWLYAITANLVRKRRSRDRLRRWLWGGGSVQEAEQLPSRHLSPVEELERRQAGALVYAVLDQLAERHRTVLILFEIEGHSGDETAELLRTRVATVWVQLHRARAAFLKELQRQRKARERREVMP